MKSGWSAKSDRGEVSLDIIKVRLELNWQQRYADLRTIVVDTWRWDMKLAGKG